MTGCSPRTRTRSGCLNCRRRKRKCDGARPECSYCVEHGERCRYGVKASFHPSRQLGLSAEDSAALHELEEQREGASLSASRFVDNTAQIVQSYEDPHDSGVYIGSPPGVITARRKLIPLANGATSDDTDAQSSASVGDISGTEVVVTTTTPINHPPPGALGFQSVNHGSDDGVLSSATTSSLSHSLSTHSAFVAPAYFEVDPPVPKLEQLQLIRAYLHETGTWCEVTDLRRHFTVSYVHRLMTNKPFAAAAMALASRQLDAIRKRPRDSTMRLYQHAVQSLLHYEPSQCGEATLVCCVLLSMYEMMTSDVAEWRRHLKGCVFNLMNMGWNGASPGLVGAAFWAFARIDIWAAYVLEERTLIPPESWWSHADAGSVAKTGTPDDYCNLTTLALAKIINLLAGGVGHDRGSVSTEINGLWSFLQVWQSHRPAPVLPVLRTESGGGNPFPVILHAGDASICGNTFYHAACILLLRTGQVQRLPDEQTQDPIWHAKELCGLSTANVSHACWVHQVYPLYIAGEAFGTAVDKEDGAEFGAEKFALLKHLATIERDTGWPTGSKATVLRKLWGLE